MKRKAGGFDLPRELEEKILSKLSTKSLQRFRSVCRSWNFLIMHRLQHRSRTADLREHIAGLKRQIEEDESALCSLCGKGRLLLAPIPRYCSCCTKVIKPGLNYYRTDKASTSSASPEHHHSFCTSCYKHAPRTGIPVFGGGPHFLKKTLLVAKNIQEIEESWVKCVKCGVRNHVICGLQNDLEERRYRCPECRLCSDDPGLVRASDLPATVLGDFIQKRLEKRMREERPGAEGLVVRVVMSSSKTLAVNDGLLGVLREDYKEYPAEFRYTAKMVMLFQKIEGVDVCIFTMYVHEYGSGCPAPNRRYAYISYMDSAKHFTPNVSASTGEPLRTVAYHEILISYMAYVKRRGFARCYLWSCPPVKGEHYILNCHPQTQKTPNPDRLRQWYLRLLKKATQEGIVVNKTTLYDRFFVPSGAPVTAARLPYFDGDYFPAMVDPILKEIDEQAKERARKGINKTVTHTSMKVLGITDPSHATNNSILFMQKLGQTMLTSKENFMVIDLQPSCAQCHDPILSGVRYTTKNSYTCQRCFDQMDHSRDSVSRFEIVEDVASETKDEDGTLENEMCDTRYKFLSFCAERQYQFDTLRRAKYASVMILRHMLYALSSTSKAALSPNEVTSAKSDDVIQRWELVEILRHVSKCRYSCDMFGCREMHGMFNHVSSGCERGYEGGCDVCHKLWYTLYCHSQACSEPDCQIPRCRQMKE